MNMGKKIRASGLARKLARWVAPGQTVLDVGSGRGLVSERLAQISGVIPTLCDVLNYNETSLPFMKMQEPTRLPVGDRSFDIVTLSFVLHHIAASSDQIALLREVLRVASKRVLVLEDTPFNRVQHALNVAWDWVQNAPNGVPTPFTFRSVDAWHSELSRDGFRVVSTESFRSPWPTMGMYRISLLVAERA